MVGPTELGQSKAAGIRVKGGPQTNSSTLLQLLDLWQCLATHLLPHPALPPPSPAPRDRQRSTYCSSGILSTARSECG